MRRLVGRLVDVAECKSLGLDITVPRDIGDFRERNLKIQNELGIENGIFGWCYCRKAANHFCVESRMPVCSIPCKLQVLPSKIIKKILIGQNQIS